MKKCYQNSLKQGSEASDLVLPGWNHSKEFKQKFTEAVSKPKLYARKLSDSQVLEIRRRKSEGETCRSLAVEFDVNQNTISKICRFLNLQRRQLTYGTVNLNNLLKFIDLRTHMGAQWEIQRLAEACLEIATDLFPETVGAYRKIRNNL